MNKNWDQKEIETARKMRDEGLGGTAIAERLGRSRSSVVAKLRKEAGLSRPPSHNYRSGFLANMTARAKPKPLAPSTGDAAKIFGRGASLYELKRGECRWPVGDLKKEGLVFCADACDGERNYCARHTAVSKRMTRGFTESV